MSTQLEITRLQTARNKIRTWLVTAGLATSTDKLDVLATAIDGIANQGAVDANVKEGETYIVPKGYHNGSGTVKGVAGGGNYNLQSKTVTPTKSQQNVAPDQGYYGLSAVTVNAIPEAYQDTSSVTAGAGDVRANKIIVTAEGEQVAGTLADNGSVNKTLDAATGNQEYTIPSGIHSGSGKVKIVLEEKAATPAAEAQDITPSTGKVLGKVTVAAIPEKYADTSDSTGSGGTEITEAEYNALLAEIREKAQLVDDVYNGVKTLDDVPVEWQEEIQRRVTERQEAEQAEPEETELEDAIAALKLLGVEAK